MRHLLGWLRGLVDHRRALSARDVEVAAADARLWDEHREMIPDRFTGNGWDGEAGQMGGG